MLKRAISASFDHFGRVFSRPKAISGPVFASKRPLPMALTSLRGVDSIESAPISDDVLARWDAGIVAAEGDNANVIDIYDIIGEDFWSGGGVTAKTVSRRLAEIGSNDVVVNINSPGGDMFEGIAIYNILAKHSGKVTVNVTALAASAASIIAMAGDEVLMGEGAFIMVHNCWTIAMGNRHDFRKAADHLEPFDNAMIDVYVQRTGEKRDVVADWLDNETYFGATAAIEKGLASGKMSKDKIKTDAKAREQQRAFNAVRELEFTLCRKSGKSRSQARNLIAAIKGMPGAAQTTTQDAGVSDLKQAAEAFIADAKKLSQR